MSVPLGWDIVATQHDPDARKYLPELGGVASGTIGGAVGEAVGEVGLAGNLKKFAVQIGIAIVAGSLTAVGTEILLDYLRASSLYQQLVLKNATGGHDAAVSKICRCGHILVYRKQCMVFFPKG